MEPPHELAQAFGVRYIGAQERINEPPLWLFTEPVTQTTFSVPSDAPDPALVMRDRLRAIARDFQRDLEIRADHGDLWAIKALYRAERMEGRG